MDANQLLQDLRALANRWALKAREFARDSRDNQDASQAQYYRGFAEGYYKAATELAAVLKGESPDAAETAARPTASGDSPQSTSAAPTYLALSMGEVVNILSFSGTSARDVSMKPGNTFYATFSKWEPLSEPERVAKIAGADPRITVLGNGRTKDTNDPYVEFAFKQG
ncbi:MAG: hypothetical protein SF162_02045 [bacterium]|nr:hypothetical protein [bacterium]